MADIKRIIQILINSKYDGKGVRDAAGDLGSLVGVVGSIGKGLATGGAAVLGTLSAITLASSEAADQMRDLSIRTGIQVDDLSALGYAAKQSGTDVQELAGGLRVLVREADSAARGSEEAQAKFARLGISGDRVAQLLKDPKELLLEVADGLQRVEAGGARSAAILDLFGRSGGNLTELLAGGSAEIRRMTEEAERLGVVLDPDAADRADRFQDALGKARAAGGALGTSISQALLPKLTQLVERLADAIAKTAEWVDQNPQLVEGLAQVAVGATGAGLALGTVANVATGISGLKDAPAVIRGLGTALRFLANPAIALVLLGIAAAIGTVKFAVDSLDEQKIDLRNQVTERLQTDPRAQGDLALLQRPGPLTRDQRLDNIEASKRLGELRKTIEQEIRAEQQKTWDDALEQNRQREEMLRKAREEREALEAKAISLGLSVEETLRFEELGRQIEKLSNELDRMKAPEALKQLRVELALARQSAGDIKFLEGVAKDQAAQFGVAAAEILAVLDEARLKTRTERERLEEMLQGLSGSGPRLGARRSETGFTPDIPIPEDPVASEGRSLLDNRTDGEREVEEFRDSLLSLRDVGVTATSEVGAGIGDIVRNLITGEGAALNLGKVLVAAFAQAAASIAAAVAQLILLNAGLALFTGGPFSPFKGIGKLFGAAEGGVVRGGIPGRDSVPVLAQQGELITPAPLTAKLESYLDRYFNGQAGPGPAPSRRTELHLHTGIFAGSRAELQEVARLIQDSERELNFGTAY